MDQIQHELFHGRLGGCAKANVAIRTKACRLHRIYSLQSIAYLLPAVIRRAKISIEFIRRSGLSPKEVATMTASAIAILAVALSAPLGGAVAESPDAGHPAYTRRQAESRRARAAHARRQARSLGSVE